MAEEFDGINLNKLVSEILNQISSVNDKDNFASKLQDAHYSYNPKYDEYEYELRAIDEYCVTADFPRITRAGIPSAIAKASFDLTISEILPHKK